MSYGPAASFHEGKTRAKKQAGIRACPMIGNQCSAFSVQWQCCLWKPNTENRIPNTELTVAGQRRTPCQIPGQATGLSPLCAAHPGGKRTWVYCFQLL